MLSTILDNPRETDDAIAVEDSLHISPSGELHLDKRVVLVPSYFFNHVDPS